MSRAAMPQTAKTPVAPPSKAPISASTPTIPQEKIAQRAYAKWLKRGCTHGCDLQDWVEAEAEIRAESGGHAKQGMTSPSRR